MKSIYECELERLYDVISKEVVNDENFKKAAKSFFWDFETTDDEKQLLLAARLLYKEMLTGVRKHIRNGKSVVDFPGVSRNLRLCRGDRIQRPDGDGPKVA